MEPKEMEDSQETPKKKYAFKWVNEQKPDRDKHDCICT